VHIRAIDNLGRRAGDWLDQDRWLLSELHGTFAEVKERSMRPAANR